MGTILHTGDFRYSKKMPHELKALYPEKNRNSRNEAVSICIDELILDATYCDPMFVFPRRVNKNSLLCCPIYSRMMLLMNF